MLNNNSEISNQRTNQYYSYQIDDERFYPEPVYRPLTVGINGIANTSEERIIQDSAIFGNERKDSGSCLKSLLLGAAVVLGTGLLAVGGYYCYIAGRLSRTTLPCQENFRMIVDNPIPSIQVEAWSSVEDFSAIPQTSLSPYAYYENEQNKASIVSTTDASEITSSEENQNSSSTTEVKDNYYLLDSPLKKELARFCLSNNFDFVIKYKNLNPKDKCDLLSKLIDKIFYYKNIVADLREIYIDREQLDIEEENNIILMKRKLTTLYFAAETMIGGNNISNFYINAMNDDKDYSLEELDERENSIVSYLSAHQRAETC